MAIGQLAKAADVTIDTVRFYERHGLLPKPQRRASGYRQYSVDDARRLKFIRRAKDLGFTLSDIGELLRLRTQSTQSERSTERVRNVARKNLETVEAKIRELERMRNVLSELVEACPGHGAVDQCPILRVFDQMDSVDQIEVSCRKSGAKR